MNIVAFIFGGEAGVGVIQEFSWKVLLSMNFSIPSRKAGRPGGENRLFFRRPVKKDRITDQKMAFPHSPFSFIPGRGEKE